MHLTSPYLLLLQNQRSLPMFWKPAHRDKIARLYLRIWRVHTYYFYKINDLSQCCKKKKKKKKSAQRQNNATIFTHLTSPYFYKKKSTTSSNVVKTRVQRQKSAVIFTYLTSPYLLLLQNQPAHRDKTARRYLRIWRVHTYYYCNINDLVQCCKPAYKTKQHGDIHTSDELIPTTSIASINDLSECCKN